MRNSDWSSDVGSSDRQRALARAVLSHDAQNLARLDFQVQVPQRPEIVALVMAREGQEFLHVRPQAGGPAGLVAPPHQIALSHPFDPDGIRRADREGVAAAQSVSLRVDAGGIPK